jgi:3-carboxy-cis,cis-muconate cycloisomerase
MATDSTSISKGPARLSSSRSEASGSLLGGISGRGGAAGAVADRALLQALLDVEAALARAWANVGVIPPGAAEAIAEACVADAFDIEALGTEAARHAQPVVGLVAVLRAAVGSPHAEHVHHAATSQDVLDTALMLVARRALDFVLTDLRRAADACAVLAETHAATPIIGRTLMQQATATTFGRKAAGWMTGLDDARVALAAVRDDVLAVQLGGPVGTLHEPSVVAAVAGVLGLVAPVLPWHTDRRRPAQLAAALGVAAGAAAKVARDVVLLAQQEVGEVREGGDATAGASSSMPHKRNPVAAISALACAERVPALVATVLGAMAQEHERAAGAWQAEWETLLELLRLSGSAVAWVAELTGALEVDPARMAANLAAAPGDGVAPTSAAALVRDALAARPGREP